METERDWISGEEKPLTALDKWARGIAILAVLATLLYVIVT